MIGSGVVATGDEASVASSGGNGSGSGNQFQAPFRELVRMGQPTRKLWLETELMTKSEIE